MKEDDDIRSSLVLEEPLRELAPGRPAGSR